jgi:uncharacterized Zn-finger protein
MTTTTMSNFKDAVRLTKEQQLSCPSCGAANRPGATYVELQQNGDAFCMVCSKQFKEQL